MDSTLQEISLLNLSLALIPFIIILGFYIKWSLGTTTPIYSVGRMLVQLMIVGYFLSYLFNIQHGGYILAILIFMVLVSSWIALRTLPEQRLKLYLSAFMAIFIGGGFTLFTVTQGVLTLEQWYMPQVMIPLAGMVFASSMNSVSLVAERFYSEIDLQQPYEKARNTAFQVSMIPTINSLFSVGLVAIPGMMTGQILSGVDPLIAARYQIMVMLMLLGSAGLSAILFLVFIKKQPAT